jgi:DNA-binding CsgD family transcriptional regulator
MALTSASVCVELGTANAGKDRGLTAFAEIAELIDAIGQPRFGTALDAVVSAAVPFDLSAVFAYPETGNPALLHDGLRNHGSQRAMSNYLRGTYLLDAVYQATVDRKPDGLHRLLDLAPDDFLESDYSKSADVHPCISMASGSLAEELVFLARLANGATAAYSVMRSNGSPVFSESEFAVLQALSGVICKAMQRHWADHVFRRDASGGTVWSKRGQMMEIGFENFAQDILSPRERMIVRLMLQGHSAPSISTVLEIAEGTVKNHKKNIYAKLAISSQNELFAAFVRHVCGGADQAGN